MNILLAEMTLASQDWIIIISLIASILGIITAIDTFTTKYKPFNFIRRAFRIKHNGIVDSKFLKKKRKFDGEVFAIELLQEDIVIKKTPRGETSVSINRNNVKEALVNNAGKEQIINKYAHGNQEHLRNKEKEIQEFISSTYNPMNPKLNLSLQDYPLRWASGGVLSIVNYKGKKWVPMFFRDIAPYGWNISLGSSERSFNKRSKPDYSTYENELNSPLNYIEREFLEETLVLTNSPQQNKDSKARYFKGFSNNLNEQKLKQTQDYNEHAALRKEYDKLTINFNSTNTISPRLLRSNMEVSVEKDKEKWPTRDVFVCFNMLELGIEVVKVIEYDLDDNDYLLDGEVLEKDGKKELVRMPVALISLDYLEREFSGSEGQAYTMGTNPSIEAENKMKPDEAVLFDWDIKQRFDIINGVKEFVGTERERYEKWNKAFGSMFIIKEDGNFNLPKLFTPATIRVFKQYLAHKEQEQMSTNANCI